MKSPETRTRRKLVLIGAIALVVVIGLAFATAPSDERAALELPEHVDVFDGIHIEEQQVPLADQHITTSKSTTRKTVKLSKKSKKTYTRTLPDKVSKSTEDKIAGSFRVSAYKIIKTSTREKYRRGSGKKTVITTVTTTVATTVEDLAPKNTAAMSLQNPSAAVNKHEQTKVRTTEKSVKTRKAKKTYIKTLPVKTKKTTEEIVTDNYRVVITTTVRTATKEKYVKGRKRKTVMTTANTTVVTRVFRLANKETNDVNDSAVADEETGTGNDENKTDAGDNSSIDTSSGNEDGAVKQIDTENRPATEQNSEQGPEQPAEQPIEQSEEQNLGFDIRRSASKAGENILKAFEDMGFTFQVDSEYSYTGYFSAGERCLILSVDNDNIYHELGHFVAFAAGNVDNGSAFKSVYNEEKGLYDGRNASYVLGTSSEYFAESYREYVLDGESLQSQRPKTYAAIENAASRITDAQVKRIMTLYGSMWE